MSHVETIVAALRSARGHIDGMARICVEVACDEKGCIVYLRPWGRQRIVEMPAVRSAIDKDGGPSVKF